MAVLTLEIVEAVLERASLRLMEKLERVFEQNLKLLRNTNQANEEVIKERKPEKAEIGASKDFGLVYSQITHEADLEEIIQISIHTKQEVQSRSVGAFKAKGRISKGQTFFKNEILILIREEYVPKGYLWRGFQVFKTLKFQLQNQETVELQLQNQGSLKLKEEICRIRKKAHKKVWKKWRWKNYSSGCWKG